MRRTALLLFSLLVLGTQLTSARVFYVALNGNNNNSGTLSQPWRNIYYPCSSGLLMAGDTVVVRGGTYPETIILDCSGSPNAPILLRNYPGETVSINPGRFRLESGANYWKLCGFTILYSSASGIEVVGTHAVGCLTVQSCVISHHKENGVYLASPNFGGVAIYDCDIQWNGEWQGQPTGQEGSGIVMYGTYGKLWARQNLIANNWAKGIAHGSETAFVGDSSVIDSNLIINNYESGLDFRADNSYIRYNYFSRNGVRDPENGEWGDKGLSLANQSTGCLVAFNVIKSSGGMELDPRGGNNKYYHNTIIKDHYYTTVPGSPYSAAIIFWQNNLPNNEFKNNLIINYCSQPEHHYAIIAETYQRYTEQIWSHNLYWSPNATAQSPYNRPFKLYNCPQGTYLTLSQIQSLWPGEDIGSLYADPDFVSYPDSNFYLAYGSPAVDAGVNVGFPYSGNAPDIGRFERVNTPPSILPNVLDFITDEDQSFSYSLTPHEYDPEQSGAELIWSVNGMDPTLAIASVDPNDLLTIVPLLNQFGSDSILLTLADGQGGADSQSVLIMVNSTNDPPWIDPSVADPTMGPMDSTLISLSPHGHDVEDPPEALVWELEGADPALLDAYILPETQTLVLIPLTTHQAVDSVSLILQDSGNLQATQDLLINLAGLGGNPGLKFQSDVVRLPYHPHPDSLDLRQLVLGGTEALKQLKIAAEVLPRPLSQKSVLHVSVSDGYLRINPISPAEVGLWKMVLRMADLNGRVAVDTLTLSLFDPAATSMAQQVGEEIWQIAETNQTVRANSFQLHVQDFVPPPGFASFQRQGGVIEVWQDISGTEEFWFSLLPDSQNILSLRLRYTDGSVSPEQSVVIMEDSTPPQKPTGLRWSIFTTPPPETSTNAGSN